jgi:transcriptional regulator with XRE-family HTH domain
MTTLGERIDAAIRSSGKSGRQIADALKVNVTTISRLRSGKEENPKLKLLAGLARETGTPLAALLGLSFEVSPEDEELLLHLHAWVEEKLRAVDARSEPNGRLISTEPRPGSSRVSERPSVSGTFSAVGSDLTITAVGESMAGDGILPDDTLFVKFFSNTDPLPAGKIVACRLGEGLFVKRLAQEGDRYRLVSANPRYLPIDLTDEPFEILGVVIARAGRVE